MIANAHEATVQLPDFLLSDDEIIYMDWIKERESLYSHIYKEDLL